MTIQQIWYEALFEAGIPRDVIERSHPPAPDGAHRHLPDDIAKKFVYRIAKLIKRSRSKPREELRAMYEPIVTEMLKLGEYRNN